MGTENLSQTLETIAKDEMMEHSRKKYHLPYSGCLKACKTLTYLTLSCNPIE